LLIEKKASPVLNSSFLDVKKSSGDFQYNSNGSLVCDGTRGITNIRYDDNNNPIRIQFDNGNVTKNIYTVTGQKLRTIHYTAPKNVHVKMGEVYEDIEKDCLSADSTDYLVDGNIIYKNNCFSKILFDGGFIGTNSGTGPTRPIRPVGISDGQYHQQLESWIQLDMNIYGYNFYNKDHLGNIREIVDKNGQICQKTDYYPYGTPILFDPFTINDTSHPYKYNGKELDMMHGLNTYDYGARQYYSALPLWDRVDPLAEKYYSISPYAYCANNPVNFVDPDGKKIKIILTGQDRINVLEQMQKLTNDKLEVLHNGEVRIVEYGIMNTSGNLPTGTKLISSLIEDEHCTSIDRYSVFKNRAVFPAEASNGTGSDTKVLVNFYKKYDLLVKDKKSGLSVVEESPSYINLGHELIHAYHTVNGVKKKDDDYSEYVYKDTNGRKFRTSQRTEELETVGIKGGSPFTENMLRDEHGINKRIKY
jgi:RHS repeat-associated protein